MQRIAAPRRHLARARPCVRAGGDGIPVRLDVSPPDPPSRAVQIRHALRPLPVRISIAVVNFVSAHPDRRPRSSASFKVPGSPYRWGFAAAMFGARPFLVVFGEQEPRQRRGGARMAVPASARRLPAWGAHLRVGHVHTDTALGPFGQIDLTFRSRGPVRSTLAPLPGYARGAGDRRHASRNPHRVVPVLLQRGHAARSGRDDDEGARPARRQHRRRGVRDKGTPRDPLPFHVREDRRPQPQGTAAFGDRSGRIP